MLLTVRHVTRYAYAPPVAAVTMRLKLFPSRFDGQRVRRWKLTVNDDLVRPELRDSWGDEVATVFARGRLNAIEIVAEGEVETTDLAGVLRGHRTPMRPAVCLRTTPRTEPNAEIRALAGEAAGAEGTALARAHLLRDLVSARIAYTPGATDPATTAARALEAGAGVCQDHAHVLIAAARSLGWPARYVAGYYLPSPETVGDVATHAWAEIWVQDLGWVGFDATNDLCPTDAYIRVCAGLDAYDAAPVRGHAEGVSEETLSVDVSIAAGETQSQRQQ